ncbi:hypothetical protein phiOC_p026 [Ochrobactrum phage vB_OspM_OC]|nr:hypothetical protein phiOC_p026 [Ochrobactrum phage vB_OspM_OC]
MSGFNKARKLAEDELIFSSRFESTDINMAILSLTSLGFDEKLLITVRPFDLANFNITKLSVRTEVSYFLELNSLIIDAECILADQNKAMNLMYIQIRNDNTMKLEFVNPNGESQIDVLIANKTATFDYQRSDGEIIKRFGFTGSDLCDNLVWFVETMVQRHRLQMGGK